MSYNNEFCKLAHSIPSPILTHDSTRSASNQRRGDNTYGSSDFDSNRDTTGTGTFDRTEGRERRDNDYGVSGGEFGRTDNLGGTGGQRDYSSSAGGLGGQDRSSHGRGEFDRPDGDYNRGDGEFGGVRAQDRFDNTGATPAGAGGYGSTTGMTTGTGTGAGGYDRDRSDNDTFGARDRHEHGHGTGGGEFNRGNDTYGDRDRDRTGAGYDDTTGAQHKPTMGEKIKGGSSYDHRVELLSDHICAGTMETVTGKVTRNPAKVEHGRELKTGEIDSTTGTNTGANRDY